MSDYIASPRPLFDDKEKEGTTFVIGGATSGIVVKITKDGLEFNGYYAGLTERVKYANLREFALIEWEDIDKIKIETFEKKKKTRTPKKRTQTHIIDKPSEEYLKKLPQVTMNGIKYYMDMERRERRPVSNPEKVFNFEGLATKKPI
jgi:hypothetical protein